MIDICKELEQAYDVFMAAPKDTPEENEALAELCGWVSLYSEVYGVDKQSVALGLVVNRIINSALSEA